MAKSKDKKIVKKTAPASNAYIENAGIVLEQSITDTLEKNYMPYAMSVIVSRAIPEIDGFKPSHRKILYTMYKMGLLTSGRTKSANIVGQTMRLHPHGDLAIYETMVRLSRGYESLLHPFVDSKGNFGKAYSRDMAFAAARYTEAKLETICNEIFNDIDKDTVDFVDNYDGTTKEPTLLPVSFPTILVNPNIGIAVGMASAICPFNLVEICQTTIALMKNPHHNIADTIKAPDFPIGGQIIYDANELQKIYSTGRGSVKIRSVYSYDKANNCIDITEIPPSTTVEAIIDKIVYLVKGNVIKEVSDIRDETDLNGLKLTLDLKRGTDPEKLMQKLYKMTPLEDSFGCNFNILINGIPKIMGISEILQEWISFRLGCVKRNIIFDLKKKKEKLHLLNGLEAILVDIDKAIKIVRETEQESQVIANLMNGFQIDEIQAEYVAEIKLRHLNREYILKRIEEIEGLKKDIEQMQISLDDPQKIQAIISSQLNAIMKKHGKPRRSEIIMINPEDMKLEIETIPEYPVVLFFTKNGYFKKITPQSLRMSNENKLKEGDFILQSNETTNSINLLFFTNKGQVYKAKANDFEDTKASVMGDYLPAKMSMEEGEMPIYMALTTDFKGYMLFAFDNGKIAKIELSTYETKTNRKKLTGAYSTKAPLVGILAVDTEVDILIGASNGRYLVFNSSVVEAKSTRAALGVAVMTLRAKAVLDTIQLVSTDNVKNPARFTSKTLPAIGAIPKIGDFAE